MTIKININKENMGKAIDKIGNTVYKGMEVAGTKLYDIIHSDTVVAVKTFTKKVKDDFVAAIVDLDIIEVVKDEIKSDEAEKDSKDSSDENAEGEG